MTARRVRMKKKVVINLIKEVNKRHCIWDVYSVYYNNRSKIAVAWQDISERLDIPEYVIRAKWRNLRDQLKKEFKRYNLKVGDKYPGRWQYFNILKFIHKLCSGETSDEETENEYLNMNELTDLTGDESDDSLHSEKHFVKTEYFELTESEQCLQTQSQVVDFDMMFLISLTPYFREMESFRKLKVRNQIQDLIFKEINPKAYSNRIQ